MGSSPASPLQSLLVAEHRIFSYFRPDLVVDLRRPAGAGQPDHDGSRDDRVLARHAPGAEASAQWARRGGCFRAGAEMMLHVGFCGPEAISALQDGDGSTFGEQP